MIIHGGKIDEKALEKLCFNLNDLLEELRTGGVLTPTEVGTAIMETSGKLSVFPTAAARPVSPADLHIDVGYEGIPLTLVMDGKPEKNNLPLCGKDEPWLKKCLEDMGVSSYADVLLCYLDTDGRMTVHGFKDAGPRRQRVMAPDEVIW